MFKYRRKTISPSLFIVVFCSWKEIFIPWVIIAEKAEGFVESLEGAGLAWERASRSMGQAVHHWLPRLALIRESHHSECNTFSTEARGQSLALGISEQSLCLTVMQSGFIYECVRVSVFPFPSVDLSLGDKIEPDECHSKAITSNTHDGRAEEHSVWPRAAACEN